MILGAGASKPYSFPLGEQLKHLICDELSQSNSGSVKQIEGLGYDTERILEFSNTLRQTPTLSVDAFLEHRKDFIEFGKIAIAQELKKYEETNNLFGNIKGDWYKYLFQRMNEPFEEFGNNKIAFITFNYDRSIEHYLFTALKNLSNRDPEECIDKLKEIPIIHLYGKLGDLPYMGNHPIEYDTGAPNDTQLLMAANEIRIITEEVADDNVFRQANRLIKEAGSVLFIGFGYNTTNLDRLRLDDISADSNKTRTTIGTTWGLSYLERKNINSYFQSKKFPIIIEKDKDAYNLIRDFPLS